MKQIVKVLLLLLPVWSLVPVGPIELSPNTENSPSVYLFPFKLSKNLPKSGYLLITMPNYQTAITPTSCKLVNTSIALECTNFQTPTLTSLTVTSSSLATACPNIDPMLTMIISSDTDLTAGTSYYLQVILANVIPSTSILSNSFEFYSVSYNSIVYEQNWNFGQVMYQPRQTNVLTINNLTSLTAALPGSLSILQASITINANVATAFSRLKVVLQQPFTFSLSSRLTTYNDPLYTTNGNSLYLAPGVLMTNVLTPNVLIATFNQSFVVGRKFILQIKDILSPFTRSSAYFSFYSLPFNSNNPYESNQLNLQISTTFFPLTVSLGLPQSMPISSDPIQMYQNMEQYLVISVVAYQDIPAGYALYLNIPAFSVIPGTAYANTSTTNTSQVIYNFTTNSILVSGFGVIASGATIQVSLKATITSASVQVFASLDLYSKTFPVASPLFYGQTPTYTAVTGATFMTNLWCSGSYGGQATWNLYSMSDGSASNIQFTINVNDSSTGSFLDVYMSSMISTAPSFSTSTSCTVSTVGSVPCAVKINSAFLNIQINSSSTGNYFPLGQYVTVTINDLRYVAPSSHSNYIYPFFFKFTRSEAVSSITYSWMYTPNVLPQRDQVGASFYLTISNDIPNAGVYYPNVIRLHSTAVSAWQYVIQANEIRVISVFQSIGYRSSIAVPDLGTYYCASNIAVTCKYTKGEVDTTLNQKTVLDWDRIDIFLGKEENTTNFHVIIPDLLSSSTTSFEVLMGKYNQISRQYVYLNMETTRSLTLSSSGVSLASKPQVNQTLLQLNGKAGSYAASIQVDIDPVGSAYALSSASAIIIVSTWELYNQLSSLASLTNNNSVLAFGTTNNLPLFINLGSGNYLTFIPVQGNPPVPFTFYIKNLHLPYTYDLPYYSIFLTDTNGAVDSYNEFINKNSGVFYYSVLLGLSISCYDNSVGVLNTLCFINFTNNNEIIKDGTIYVQFSGMTVATDMCFLTYETGPNSNRVNTSIPVTCTSTSNLTTLIVSLPGTSATNYPNSNSQAYQLVVYGISILGSSISQSINLTLRDKSGGYIIQTGTRLLTTTVANPLATSVNQITYQFNNPLSKSSMFVLFTLPRSLHQDEDFVMIMGQDLSDANTLISKINIVLLDSNGNIIETIQSLSIVSYEIKFTVTNPSLIVAGSYTLKIYGLQIPSSNTNDLFYIIYKRKFDGLYTITNDLSSTSPFPSLSQRINSLILASYIFNTQGLEQQLDFSITHNNTIVDSKTVWYVNLPIYYSPTVWNDNTMIYCEISGAVLPCSQDSDVPHQIKITDSPRIITNGTQYTISIFGIPCPRKIYLNNNATYSNQYVFIGVAENSSSSLYQEYIETYPNQSIESPPTIASYGLIKVGSVISTSMNCFSNSYFKINMYTSVTIAAGTTIYITFPKQFNNFYDIQLDVHILVSSVSIRQGNCNVVNRRVQVIMGSQPIAAGTNFVVEFTNLPTPEFPGVTNMNEMSVVLVESGNSKTLAASSVKTNEANQLTFISNPRYLSLNTDTTVVVTAGTYSLPIPITSSDNQKFLSNALITFSAPGFTFLPNPTSIYLGATTQTFMIGADVSLMPTQYVYNTVKTEDSLSPYYIVLTNNNIRVTNTPVNIVVPSSLTVPKGGCSIPIKVTLNNPPYSDVSINFVYNNSMYSSDIFWLNPETTNSRLNFSLTHTVQWISFCSSQNITYTSIPITLVVGGSNYLSYSLSSYSLAVTIQSGLAIVSPNLVLNPVNNLKTVAVYNFTTNTNGYIFYSLTLGSNVPPMDIINLKIQFKSMNLTIESQNDFLTHIYTKDRDYRVDMIPVATGHNQITFSNLLPQKAYTLCAYFENQFGANTDAICQTFSTLTWGFMSKSYIKFTKALNGTQLNRILCFYAKEVSAKITNVVDLMGSSCSLSSSPQNYHYTYTGSTFSLENTFTTVYLVANPQVTTDASILLFRNMFDSSTNALTATSFSDALAGFSINYISNATFNGIFDPISAQNMGVGFTVNGYFDTPYYENGVITVPNVRVDGIGSVYFILQIQKQIFYNTLSGQTNITIRMDFTPTVEQIMNCKDWNNAPVVGCARAVLNNPSEVVSVTFNGILSNSFYKIYYASANEYPLRPVSSGTVESTTVTTLVYGLRAFLGTLILITCLFI